MPRRQNISSPEESTKARFRNASTYGQRSSFHSRADSHRFVCDALRQRSPGPRLENAHHVTLLLWPDQASFPGHGAVTERAERSGEEQTRYHSERRTGLHSPGWNGCYQRRSSDQPQPPPRQKLKKGHLKQPFDPEQNESLPDRPRQDRGDRRADQTEWGQCSQQQRAQDQEQGAHPQDEAGVGERPGYISEG